VRPAGSSRVELLRQKFDEPHGADGDIRQATERVAELAHDTLPLQRVCHAGLFDDKSLFIKTLRGIATAEQFDQFITGLGDLHAPQEFVPQPVVTRGRLRRVQLKQPDHAAVPVRKD
jgi:hypothetical protein